MTEQTTLTLTDFLFARIAEDEARARSYPLWIPPPPIPAAQIIAECEAKRRIVERHAPAQYGHDGIQHACGRCSSFSTDGSDDEVVEYPCDDLVDLAQPYADHSNFQAEWRLT